MRLQTVFGRSTHRLTGGDECIVFTVAIEQSRTDPFLQLIDPTKHGRMVDNKFGWGGEKSVRLYHFKKIPDVISIMHIRVSAIIYT
jgi:hypothetical protein